MFISENALAVWDNTCFDVSRYSSESEDTIDLIFKFLEYEPDNGIQNHYLEVFNLEYSTDNSKTFTHLMSAKTEHQTTRTWAWIDVFAKQFGSKINLCYQPYRQTKHVSKKWEDKTKLRLGVSNDPKNRNQTWLGIAWYPGVDLNDPSHIRDKGITHIRFTVIWHEPENLINNKVILVHKITPAKLKLNSYGLNFSNSSPKQEIRTEGKAIVIEGALNKRIKV